ncbi:MAG: NUDIX hydrolase [Parcubacteria group bacterium Gr01-1014_18]|nr:MAG: NUDIX hydrolase [Parcubacteria group bacterium Greene0416_36]TSC80993.1 MAG: NUDIX hydrolase [Parcubacteria group bacterium Gr01-1014_18]TSC98880.1 MAG: NUDIX hydrolase [Parcubacteria group bacterium Greene1014_20]TSD06534.1 MAG: NUDIX hydrolase [Parcubacteria group bacterium Greene0714_2]
MRQKTEVEIPNIPKKKVGAAALFIKKEQGHDKILLVLSEGKDYWTLPGGVVEDRESPEDGCIREVKKEVGLAIKNPPFLGVGYQSRDTEDSLHFIFFGGFLDDKQVKRIKLQPGEILEYKLATLPESKKLVPDRLYQRLSKCMTVLDNDKAFYMEYWEE